MVRSHCPAAGWGLAGEAIALQLDLIPLHLDGADRPCEWLGGNSIEFVLLDSTQVWRAP